MVSLAHSPIHLPNPTVTAAVTLLPCRTDEADEHYGIRMCVGGDSYWTNSSIGGIATLNSFGWINNGSEVYRDSFVFSQ